MNNLRGLIVFAALCKDLLISQAFAYDCQNFKGTCKKPNKPAATTEPVCYGVAPGSSETFCVSPNDTICTQNGKDSSGKTLLYCPYFQCDAKGDVLMSTTPGDPRHTTFKGKTSWMNHLITSKFICIANCCYSHHDEKFIGETSSEPGCRNLCCPTLAGFKAGDCSIRGDKPSGGGGQVGIIEEPELPDKEIIPAERLFPDPPPPPGAAEISF